MGILEHVSGNPGASAPTSLFLMRASQTPSPAKPSPMRRVPAPGRNPAGTVPHVLPHAPERRATIDEHATTRAELAKNTFPGCRPAGRCSAARADAPSTPAAAAETARARSIASALNPVSAVRNGRRTRLRVFLRLSIWRVARNSSEATAGVERPMPSPSADSRPRGRLDVCGNSDRRRPPTAAVVPTQGRRTSPRALPTGETLRQGAGPPRRPEASSQSRSIGHVLGWGLGV